MFKFSPTLIVICSIILSSCITSPPTDIKITGRLNGTQGSQQLTIEHGRNLTQTPSLLRLENPTQVGTTTGINISIDRSGLATNTGYELLTIMDPITIRGGGGLFSRGATAGDTSLYSNNTGSIAKTSYYYFDNTHSGEQSTLAIPQRNNYNASKLVLARINKDGERFAVIPFRESDATSRRSFMSAECLTRGNNPCFDMSTIIETIFSQLSSGIKTVVNSRTDIELAGKDEAGDFRLDYIPSINALRTCQNINTPAFGFIFSTHLKALAGTEIRIRIPFIFSLEYRPDGSFSGRAHPYSDTINQLTCHEDQFIKAMTVQASTAFGVGAQAVADLVRNTLICNLLPNTSTTDCSDVQPSEEQALNETTIVGLEAFLENTALYYWRQSRGNTPPPRNFGVFLRPRNADQRITSTNVTPGAADAVQVTLQFTE